LRSILIIAWPEPPGSTSPPSRCSITPGNSLSKNSKQLDCFSSPHLEPLLAQLNADRYVVYGVVTELCVQCAAFGLLKTGKLVEIVTDAVKALDEQKAREIFSNFTAAGGRLITSAIALSES
jgi:nicotinamidase-related amidase